MNSVEAGTIASKDDQSRNAAQSARNTAKNSAAHDATTNPGAGGAGDRTLLNSCHASRSERLAAPSVSAVGRNPKVVSGNTSQAHNTAAMGPVARALASTLQPRRRPMTMPRCDTSVTVNMG